MFAMLVLSVWVPSRVFFVEVEGNVTIPSRYIAEHAKNCGIYFGASRKAVRSEQVKNRLLSQMPELQWAGVNTAGCVAVITVRERNVEQLQEEKSTVSSIVAARDGIIAEMTVLRGNGLCKPGQAVKSGQVLISGYTDCGICIRATRAEGEILAHTQRSLSAVFPEERAVRGQIVGTEEKISLIIGKKQINFSKCSGISGASCAKIYEQKYMTLPGGFVLPISVLRGRITYYETTEDTETDAEAFLRKFALDYVIKQTTAGKIENQQIFVSSADGLIRLEGVFSCLEQIGVVRAEESLPSYGKSD
jgi:sporulation protein YqfD